MKLDEALYILARVHTGWDEKTGMIVHMGAMPEPFSYERSNYVEAWQRVRMHLYMNVNPSPEPAT